MPKRFSKEGETTTQVEEEAPETLEDLDAASLQEELQRPIYIVNNIEPNNKEKDDFRAISLYGDVGEQMANEVMQAILFFNHTKKEIIHKDDGTIEEVVRPIKLYVSTHGGIVSDMFSIIDIMEDVKKECPIETVGVGKVMSAGVLILAAGTKGKRKIAKHCRVMLHSVMSGHHGSFPNLENEK